MDVREFRWERILAFALGVFGVFLYLWVDPFGFLPAPVAAGLGSIPVTLLLYGLSGQSWRACITVGVGAGIGIGVGTHLG